MITYSIITYSPSIIACLTLLLAVPIVVYSAVPKAGEKCTFNNQCYVSDEGMEKLNEVWYYKAFRVTSDHDHYYYRKVHDDKVEKVLQSAIPARSGTLCEPDHVEQVTDANHVGYSYLTHTECHTAPLATMHNGWHVSPPYKATLDTQSFAKNPLTHIVVRNLRNMFLREYHHESMRHNMNLKKIHWAGKLAHWAFLFAYDGGNMDALRAAGADKENYHFFWMNNDGHVHGQIRTSMSTTHDIGSPEERPEEEGEQQVNTGDELGTDDFSDTGTLNEPNPNAAWTPIHRNDVTEVHTIHPGALIHDNVEPAEYIWSVMNSPTNRAQLLKFFEKLRANKHFNIKVEKDSGTGAKTKKGVSIPLPKKITGEFLGYFGFYYHAYQEDPIKKPNEIRARLSICLMYD